MDVEALVLCYEESLKTDIQIVIAGEGWIELLYLDFLSKRIKLCSTYTVLGSFFGFVGLTLVMDYCKYLDLKSQHYSSKLDL